MSDAAYWDKVAGKKEFTIPSGIEILSKLLPPDASILDFGCGYGRILKELDSSGYKNLYGCDFSEKMLRLAQDELPDSILRQNTGSQIPFADESFDCVIILAVLTSITDNDSQNLLMKETLRVLKSGGLLFAGDFLLNDDKRNIERYEKYKGPGEYGTFAADDGAILRHHSETYITRLFSSFEKISFSKTIFRTMNGHSSNGFYMLCRKP